MRATASLSIVAAVAVTCVVAVTVRGARETAAAAAVSPALPMIAPGTSRAELSHTIAAMKSRLASKPDDALAVLHLAQAQLRAQRVNNDGRAALDAEQHLRGFLKLKPGHYDARRLLAAVLLSQHRFGEAIAEADRTRAADPADAWNYGVIGDGYLELGNYQQAFEAFDRMGQLAPGPPAYARVAYALELSGDLDGALDYMRRASDGTSPNDPESQAWHFSQLGELLLQRGRIAEAKQAFDRAEATFPGHPLAVAGRARVKVIDGDLSGARGLLQRELAAAPTAETAMTIGDLSRALGETDAAGSYFRMAEQIERGAWQNGVPQTQLLARFFAEHGMNIGEAVRLSEAAATTRRDIATMDALSFAYLKAGRIDEAARSSAAALRTGTRDARLLWHAAEIALARGDSSSAKALIDRIPAANDIGDVVVREGIRNVRARSGNSP